MRHDAAMARFRSALAVELRADGMTYADVAATLGYTHRSAARKAVMRALAERTGIAVDLYRISRLLDLEDTHERNFRPALAGDARALARCLRASSERIDLLGLNHADA